jgi:hypothetical protein
MKPPASNGDSDLFELDFPQREVTPEPVMTLGIRPHLGELSLLYTISILYILAVGRY